MLTIIFLLYVLTMADFMPKTIQTIKEFALLPIGLVCPVLVWEGRTSGWEVSLSV